MQKACSRAPWVRKFGYLCIQEVMVVTCPSDHQSAPQAYQCKITQSTDTATQM